MRERKRQQRERKSRWDRLLNGCNVENSDQKNEEKKANFWHVALDRHKIQTYRNEAQREKGEGGKGDSVMSH